jgi:mannitol/fructose-specific phosphotransferase system IIA component (Ntr-type)
MKIKDFLFPEHICINIYQRDKDALFRFIAGKYVQLGIIQNEVAIYEGLKQREESMSTGIGKGIAMPHTFSEEAKDFSVLLIHLEKSIEFAAVDGQPVIIVWAILIPQNMTGMHLKILASISRLCMDSDFFPAFENSDSAGDIHRILLAIEDRMNPR